MTEIKIEHERVGTIQVAPEDVIRFDEIPGFPGANRFALMTIDGHAPFLMLACLDDPRLAFAVTDPTAFFADYDPLQSADELVEFKRFPREHLVVLSLVTEAEGETTINLSAPLVVNHATHEGWQVALDDDRTQVPLPQSFPAAP